MIRDCMRLCSGHSTLPLVDSDLLGEKCSPLKKRAKKERKASDLRSLKKIFFPRNFRSLTARSGWQCCHTYKCCVILAETVAAVADVSHTVLAAFMDSSVEAQRRLQLRSFWFTGELYV